MPQICVQLDEQDHAEIVRRAVESGNTSKASVAAKLIHSALGVEGNPEMEKLRADITHSEEVIRLQWEDINVSGGKSTCESW
jgi:hypothetical protein